MRLARLGFVIVAACGGAQSEDPHTVTNAPAATAVAATPKPPAQCAVLADRIDAFGADVAKVDAKTPEGLHAMSRSASAAGTDLGAVHADGELAAIAHDTSTYLNDTSRVVDEVATIVDKINAASAGIQVDSIKTCVTGPAHAIGVACKGKTTGDCPAIITTLDAWGKAPKTEEGEAIARVRALQVTEPAVKSHYAAIVTCVKPIATALDEIERSRARLRELDHTEDHRERDLDKRFKAICGRDLFTSH